MKTKQIAHLAALAALGALTAGVWQMSRAQAEPPPAPSVEQQFLDAVRAAGFDKPDSVALRNGYIACAADTQEGVNDDLLQRGIDAAQRWLGSPENPELDAAFTAAAEKYLCPKATND